MMKTHCSTPLSLDVRVAVDSLVATAGVTGSLTGTTTLNGAHGTLALHTQSAINMKTVAAIGTATPLFPPPTNPTTPPLTDHACHRLR